MRKHGKLSYWPGFLLHLLVEPWPGASKRMRIKHWRIIYMSLAKAIWWNIKDSLKRRTDAAAQAPTGRGDVSIK